MDSTITELRRMYPYFRELDNSRSQALASALTWTRFAPLVTRARLLRLVLTDYQTLRGYKH